MILSNRLNKNELSYAECCVKRKQRDALNSRELSANERGNTKDKHYRKHKGNLKHERCVLAEQLSRHRHLEGVDRYGYTGYEYKVKEVRTDDVTKRK